MAETEYPIATIAKLLNLTERRVQQLSKEGVIPRSEKGRYPLVGAVRGYIEYLQARAVGNDAGAADTYVERGRLTRANADLAELNVLELRGNLIRVPAVADHWTGMVASMRAKLLALPSRLAAVVAPPEKMQVAQELAQTLVYEALSEIAGNGLPSTARVSGASFDRGAGARGGEAAAHTDNKPVGGGESLSQS